MLRLITNFQPKGDQPHAIKKLVENIRQGQKEQPDPVHRLIISDGANACNGSLHDLRYDLERVAVRP